MKKHSKKRKEEIMKQFGGRMPTKEELFEKIRQSQERMMQALAGALENAPDDPKKRKVLLDIVEKSTTLRKGIYSKILKETPPKIRKDPNSSN